MDRMFDILLFGFEAMRAYFFRHFSASILACFPWIPTEFSLVST